MPINHWLRASLKSGLRIGMVPNMDPDKRHGSVWFDVKGQGEQRRDFVVNEPDRLAKEVEKLGIHVAEQILLLDPTLPAADGSCKPIKIDVLGNGMQRLYELNDRRFLLQQKLL